MRLLTWQGTIIRLEAVSARLIHSRLVPVRDGADDFVLALPPEGLTGPLSGPNEIKLLPGPDAGTAHLQRRGRFLSVDEQPYLLFNAADAGRPQTMLILPDEEVALLRDLLTHAWTRGDTGAVILPADMAIGPGPVLTAGGLRLVLGAHDILSDPGPDTLNIAAGEGRVRLTRVPGSGLQLREIPLLLQAPSAIPDAADQAAFAAGPEARLTLPAPPGYAIPPMLGSLADRDFVYRRGGPAAWGRRRPASQVVRARDACVLLDRGIEGTIIDERGVLHATGSLASLGEALPPHFAREGERYFIDQTLLDGAPYLAGPHVVFYGGGEQNYSQWLIGSLVPLSMIAPYLPPETTLLLPAAQSRFRTAPRGRPNYLGLLEALGLDGMKRREMPGQICRVETLYWPDRAAIEQMPATALITARARVLASHPPASGPRARIYVRRATTRAVANSHIVDAILLRYGFVPVLMKTLTTREQIDLFSRAEMVVGAHGVALANLLFCPPGTQVLELSPDCAYRPFYNDLSTKLGLGHAVLPCATDDGTFNGKLSVNGPRLNALAGLLLSRLAG